jgi:hypothetical protein
MPEDAKMGVKNGENNISLPSACIASIDPINYGARGCTPGHIGHKPDMTPLRITRQHIQ